MIWTSFTTMVAGEKESILLPNLDKGLISSSGFEDVYIQRMDYKCRGRVPLSLDFNTKNRLCMLGWIYLGTHGRTIYYSGAEPRLLYIYSDHLNINVIDMAINYNTKLSYEKLYHILHETNINL